MNLPKISVNIPLITNGDANIVLNSLRKIDYPKGLYEIIIIEGSHLAKQRNTGLKVSQGDIVYLLDDDSQVQPQSFKILAQEFSNQRVAAVGGPSLIPKNGNYLNQLLGYVLETYFGAFRMRYKWSRQRSSNNVSDYQFIAASLALRKKVVIEIGGFDGRFYPSEETDLLRRIKDKGYYIKYNERLFVYQNPRRKNSYLLAKRFYRYGEGRMRQIQKNPKLEDCFLFAPVIFGIYLISLIFFHPIWYFLPLTLYCVLGFATACKASIKYKNPSLLLTMPIIFPTVHSFYAFGMLHEFLIRKKHKNVPIKIKVYHVKKFAS